MNCYSGGIPWHFLIIYNIPWNIIEFAKKLKDIGFVIKSLITFDPKIYSSVYYVCV